MFAHQGSSRKSSKQDQLRSRQIEGREWWLWGFAVTVTLALTAGIIFLAVFGNPPETATSFWADLRDWARGLAAFVLLFDIYTMYQHLQLQRVRRRLAEQDELFQLITENAADMIAVVDASGKRLYNSPAYQELLGYSAEELNSGSSFDQIHPSDRERVLQAAEKARLTGQGERLEYRMRHKDGTWRILESAASPVRNAEGRVEKLVIVNRDITERKRAAEMLAHNALHDSLTDLPNRTLFADRLQRAWMRARRHPNYRFAVLFVDVDDFKVVNDSLGHSAGDELLVQIAQRLRGGLRETDTVSRPVTADDQSGDEGIARLGGDEFAVLLEDVFDASSAIRVAKRIQQNLDPNFAVGGRQIVMTASIGVALSGNSYVQAEDLLRDAELAMYRAKRTGKARCEVFDPAMHSSAVRRLQLETDLRRGLERGELVVYYQPIVSLRSGKIAGFEALSRWQSPDGMIPPAEFIPIADETGLIIPINRELLFTACRQLCLWQAQFKCDPPLTMSMNISPRQFAQHDLAKEIGAMLRETGVPPSTVIFEIMETIAMGDADRALSVMSDLKGLGVLLGIDDFGTGYSSLSRLPRFPVDALKIDRVFISNMNTDRDSHEIVRLIIMMAHSLGLKVVAEGTEAEAQISELKRLGCEMAQGYLYSAPVDSTTALALLTRSYQEQDTLNCRSRPMPTVVH